MTNRAISAALLILSVQIAACDSYTPERNARECQKFLRISKQPNIKANNPRAAVEWYLADVVGRADRERWEGRTLTAEKCEEAAQNFRNILGDGHAAR